MSDNNQRGKGSEQDWEDESGGRPRLRSERLFDDFEDEFEEPDRDSDFAAISTEVDEEEPAEGDDGYRAPVWEFAEQADDPTTAGAGRGAGGTREATPDGTAEDDNSLESEREESRGLNFSLGMLIVAIAALVLLGFGGYGVIEQRAEMREEIRQLQAALAISAPPAEVAASRAAAQAAAERTRTLEAQIEQLTHENHNLQAIVGGLESQLAAQQEAVATTRSPTQPARSSATTVKAVDSAPAATGKRGSWFVNFSSYTNRDSAEEWLGKLNTDQGRVVLTTGESGGQTVYRVRVVDLPDRATAEAVARTLEREFQLDRLWVGRVP